MTGHVKTSSGRRSDAYFARSVDGCSNALAPAEPSLLGSHITDQTCQSSWSLQASRTNQVRDAPVDMIDSQLALLVVQLAQMGRIPVWPQKS